jgi:FkbM family methyltransferase
MISYAQNFEDVILRRALKHVDNGFYIDIGAQDPVVDSVSLAFYEQGWRGVHVEPTLAYAQALREARPDETVIQAAIGSKGGIIPFWEFPETGLSTGAPDIAAGHEAGSRTSVRTEVPCLPLSQLLDAKGEQPIHWLKIDVEGMEDDVIESWSPSPVRPWIVVVESTRPSSQEASYAAWEPKLVTMGYEFVYFDGVNRFYVHEAQDQLKAVFGPGPNWFDSFQLGRSSAYAGQLAQDIAQKTYTLEQLSQALDAARAEVVAQVDVRDREIARAAQEYSALQQSLATTQQSLATTQQSFDSAQQSLNATQQSLDSVNRSLAAVYRSTSWRLTAPLRAFKRRTASFLEGIWAWGTLKPGSRPRRVARKALGGFADWLRARPRLRSALIHRLRRYPSLFERFRRMAGAQRLAMGASPSAEMLDGGGSSQFSDLPPHAKMLYRRLRHSIDKQQSKA